MESRYCLSVVVSNAFFQATPFYFDGRLIFVLKIAANGGKFKYPVYFFFMAHFSDEKRVYLFFLTQLDHKRRLGKC